MSYILDYDLTFGHLHATIDHAGDYRQKAVPQSRDSEGVE
jgi:hypothetical protein